MAQRGRGCYIFFPSCVSWVICKSTTHSCGASLARWTMASGLGLQNCRLSRTFHRPPLISSPAHLFQCCSSVHTPKKKPFLCKLCGVIMTRNIASLFSTLLIHPHFFHFFLLFRSFYPLCRQRQGGSMPSPTTPQVLGPKLALSFGI